MVSTSLLLAGLISLAAASPAGRAVNQKADSPAKEPKPTTYPEVEARKKLHLGTAVSGALDLPTTVTHAPKATRTAVGKAAFAANAGYMTVTVVNQNGGDITTVHVNGAGPTPVAGNTAPGRLGNGQSDSFVLPPGWNGNVAINDARFSATTGDESLIEGSFVDQGQGYAQGDLNISFVNGFSVPIVCWCNENNITTGCNKNLRDFNSCPSDNGQGSCRNPLRPDLGARQPTDFFRPCFAPGGAYTFPFDSEANNLNQKCGSEQYTCCVGTSCRNNP